MEKKHRNKCRKMRGGEEALGVEVVVRGPLGSCCQSVREFWTLTHVPWRRACVGKEPVHRSWARVLALADKVPF
eukprot:scaffold1558_cov356-Pavlova_lutheri.AAC.3